MKSNFLNKLTPKEKIMDLKKFNQNAINCIYKTAQIGLNSISNVSEEVENSALKGELATEYEGYENFISQLSAFIVEKGYEIKEVNPLKKAFMWGSIKLNTLTNDSSSHVANLMIKGTVMGITEMQEMINSQSEAVEPEIIEMAKKLKKMLEENEQKLKKYL